MHSASHTDYGRNRRSEMEEEEKSKPTKLLLLIILWGWTITLSFVSREREMIIISGLLFSARRVQCSPICRIYGHLKHTSTESCSRVLYGQLILCPFCRDHWQGGIDLIPPPVWSLYYVEGILCFPLIQGAGDTLTARAPAANYTVVLVAANDGGTIHRDNVIYGCPMILHKWDIIYADQDSIMGSNRRDKRGFIL